MRSKSVIGSCLYTFTPQIDRIRDGNYVVWLNPVDRGRMYRTFERMSQAMLDGYMPIWTTAKPLERAAADRDSWIELDAWSQGAQ
jgi:hypothetical protein